MSMSGKISATGGFVTKADFMRLQSKVDSLVARLSEPRPAQPPTTPQTVPTNRRLSGGVKSWLYSRAGSSTPRPSSADGTNTCQNCIKTGLADVRGNDQDSNGNKLIFQKRGQDESFDRNDNQRCTRNEFNQFQADLTRDIKSLQKSVRDLQILCDDLEKSVHESLAYLQSTIDKMNVQILATTERLDLLCLQNKHRFVGGSEAIGTLTAKQKSEMFLKERSRKYMD